MTSPKTLFVNNITSIKARAQDLGTSLWGPQLSGLQTHPESEEERAEDMRTLRGGVEEG